MYIHRNTHTRIYIYIYIYIYVCFYVCMYIFNLSVSYGIFFLRLFVPLVWTHSTVSGPYASNAGRQGLIMERLLAREEYQYFLLTFPRFDSHGILF